jgi:hypothetical protein
MRVDYAAYPTRPCPARPLCLLPWGAGHRSRPVRQPTRSRTVRAPLDLLALGSRDPSAAPPRPSCSPSTPAALTLPCHNQSVHTDNSSPRSLLERHRHLLGLVVWRLRSMVCSPSGLARTERPSCSPKSPARRADHCTETVTSVSTIWVQASLTFRYRPDGWQRIAQDRTCSSRTASSPWPAQAQSTQEVARVEVACRRA